MQRFVERLGHFSAIVALCGSIGICIISGCILADVLMRWLFNAPLMFVSDIGHFNSAVFTASFFPLCILGRHFIAVRFLGTALGERASAWLEVFSDLATLVVFSLIAVQMFRFAARTTQTGLGSKVLEIPQYPWWWAVWAIIAFSLLVQAMTLIRSIVYALQGKPAPLIDVVA